jgi:hypothetical protein
MARGRARMCVRDLTAARLDTSAEGTQLRRWQARRSAANPLGAKGAGEAGTVGVLSAVVNAIVDALAPLGRDHIATPEQIWAAIRLAERKGPRP